MKSKIKLGVAGIAAMFAAVQLTAGSAMAWGPERETYTMESPATKPVFNSITNNPALGDERDFVRIVEIHDDGTRDKYSSNITVQPGKKYSVYIYYHNNASTTFNDKAHNYSGVATTVKMYTTFPYSLKKGERGKVDGMISWTGKTDPTLHKVWDDAFITASADMSLHYVSGTAKIWNSWGVNGKILPDTLFTSEGAYLGLNEFNGIILGCGEYSGHVTYEIETKAITTPEPEPEPTPPTPEPEPTPPTPDPEPTPKPEELPNTGPMEMMLGLALIVIVCFGVAFFIKSHRAVKHATSSARGRRKK